MRMEYHALQLAWHVDNREESTATAHVGQEISFVLQNSLVVVIVSLAC